MIRRVFMTPSLPDSGGAHGAGSAAAVCVKWGKEKYDVTVDTDESAVVFKAQLLALTGVPVDRQKILVKGGQLKVRHGLALYLSFCLSVSLSVHRLTCRCRTTRI
jgi:hypothetical protein